MTYHEDIYLLKISLRVTHVLYFFQNDILEECFSFSPKNELIKLEGKLFKISNLDPNTKYKIITKWIHAENFYELELSKLKLHEKDILFITLPESK